jgi:farnesyl diphosphate synthase
VAEAEDLLEPYGPSSAILAETARFIANRRN